ncbi:MAG: hypothetical protein AAGF11_34985 [Myxococcota bacterium]
MAQSNGSNKYFLLGALALTATVVGIGTGTSAVAAQETLSDVMGGQDRAAPASSQAAIATNIDHSDYNEPDGTCAMCFASTDGHTNPLNATVQIYFEDNGEDFRGDFELTMELNGGGLADAVIAGASIDHQQTGTYTVPAGTGWDWDDVDSVTILAVPDV